MVDGIDDDLAGAQFGSLLGDVDHTAAAVLLAVVRPRLVTAEQALLRVDHDDDALAAHLVGDVSDEVRILDGARADRHLLYPQADDALGLLRRLYAAAVAQGHAAFRCELRNEPEVGFATMGGGIYVEDDQFVGLLLVEDLDRVDRIAHVLRVLETYGLDQPIVVDQEAGSDSGPQHVGRSAKFFNSWAPK